MSGNSHTLSNVAPGNYSFRLRAQSLGGSGEWTESRFFVIEVNQENIF